MIPKPQQSNDHNDYGWIVKEAKCWVYSPQQNEGQIYKKGAIKGNSKVMGLLENGSPFETKAQYVEKCRVSTSLENDLIDLETINAAEVLDQLKRKLHNKVIHTYLWNSLIIVNPFKLIPEQYHQNKLLFFIDHIFIKKENHRKFQPHIFNYMCSLLVNMRNKDKVQVITISGESGSGKTQTNKQCLKVISYCCQRKQLEDNSIEVKILKCDAILQSFGNAKTVKNDNSSRFGKLITITIDNKLFKIIQSDIKNFFLEKSRLITQAPGQRNFHIFYQFIKYTSIDVKNKFHLMKNKNRPYQIEDFKYFNKDISKNQQTLDDKTMWLDLLNAFNILKFDHQTIDSIYSILSGILLLGNVQFDSSDQNQVDPCSILSTEIISHLSKLFKVPLKQLTDGLLFNTKTLAGQTLKIPLTGKQCGEGRDSTAKGLYEGLFYWLVENLNKKVNEFNDQVNSGDVRQVKLLDIYGFEVFQRNSFEQLCVNYTNQKIHQIYLDHIFKHEKNTLKSQGLQFIIAKLNFTDNYKIIQLLDSNPRSIYNLLDESCTFNVKDDDFLSNVKTSHQNHEHFPPSNSINVRKSFIIHHTPGHIEYFSQGFREKNKDLIRQDIIIKLSKSQNTIISNIFTNKLNILKNENNKKFLGTKIRKEVNMLINEISLNSQLNFIRCIKPNENKQPLTFVDRVCYNQIKYLGILDTIHMRKDTYHVRMNYSLFYSKYGIINDDIPKLIQLSEGKVTESQCKQLTMQLFKNLTNYNLEYLFGNHRIFMKMQTQHFLDRFLENKTKAHQYACLRIKFYYLRNKRQNIRKKHKQNVTKIQRNIRYFLSIAKEIKYKLAVRTIEREWINNYQQYFKRKKRKPLMIIQKYMKKMIESNKFQHRAKAAHYIKNILNSAVKTNKIYKKYQSYIAMREDFLSNIYNIIWNKMKNGYIKRIQSNILSYFTRLRNKNYVFSAENKARYRSIEANNKMITKYMKGIVQRLRYRKRINSIIKIQSYWRMKIYRISFLHLRSSAMVIQKNWRQYKDKKNSSINFAYKYFEEEKELKQQNLVWNQILFRNYENNGKEQNYIQQILRINQKIKKDKIMLFYYLLDFQVLTDVSQIYPQCSWVTNYSELFKSSFDKHNPIQYIDVSEQLTVCSTTNKVYCWGKVNQDKHIITNINLPQGCKIKYIKSDSEMGVINIVQPSDTILIGQKQKYFQKSAKQWRTLHNTFVNFNGVILTVMGISLNKLNIPQKVIQLSCGMDHSICKTSLKKVYSWGSNQLGQLGHGHYHKVKQPKQIDYFNKHKILCCSVGASAYGSIILDTNGKLWWFGSNGTIKFMSVPTQCILSMKSEYIDNPQKYSVIRVIPKWSKTISLIGITLAYHDNILKTQISLRKKIIQNLISKWSEDISTVNPPFIQNIAGYFHQKNMPFERPVDISRKQKSPSQHQVRQKIINQINFMNQMQKELLSTRSKNDPKKRIFK